MGCAAGAGPASNANAAGPTYELQPFDFAKGSLNEQEDDPKTPRTGQVVLCLAGDSTVNYSTGYGAGLRAHFDERLQVINRSRGGRTTASFRSDGRWQDIINIKPDYVMIQFGHNDTAALTPAVYAQNLVRFVDEARAATIIPILVTPVARRYWQADGTIKDDLDAYCTAMKQVAADKNVLLMDLHQRAIEAYLRAGKDVTDSWSPPKANPALATASPAERATLPATVLDKTHFNAAGGQAMGLVVADELKKIVPALAPYIH